MIEPKRISETTLRPQRGFRGSLAGIDLASLLQMTCARGERAVLCLGSGGREGFIYIAERRVVHATLGFVIGEQALNRMLRFTDGDFSLCERAWPARFTIHDSLETVLIRAAHADDEQARIASSSMSDGAASSEDGETSEFVSALRSKLDELKPKSQLQTEGSLLASVRIDVNGQIVSHHGDVAALAPLVAYVTRLGAILGAQLGLRPFEALSAELGAHRALIFVDGNEMVGLLLVNGLTYAELRRQLRV